MSKPMILTCDDLAKAGLWNARWCSWHGMMIDKSPAPNKHGKVSHVSAHICKATAEEGIWDIMTRSTWAFYVCAIRIARSRGC
jgi:hypothetical protein